VSRRGRGAPPPRAPRRPGPRPAYARLPQPRRPARPPRDRVLPLDGHGALPGGAAGRRGRRDLPWGARPVPRLRHACATRLARETGALAILVRRTAGPPGRRAAGPPGAMFSGGGTLDHIGTRGGARCSAHPDERHLRRVLTEYVAYDNHRGPHQGLDQRCPVPAASVPSDGVVERHDALGGVIHDYGPRAA